MTPLPILIQNYWLGTIGAASAGCNSHPGHTPDFLGHLICQSFIPGKTRLRKCSGGEKSAKNNIVAILLRSKGLAPFMYKGNAAL
jgi:hypothetical protein